MSVAKDISVVLVDDHVIVRNGLKSLIELIGSFKVTNQYDNGDDFVKAFPMEQEPDLVIMDLNMPVMNGLEAMHWVRRHKPNLRVLILTLDTDERTIIQLYRLGVRGYLPKNTTAEELRDAIENVVFTGYYHSEMAQKALNSDQARHGDNEVPEVTDREMEFITLVCDPQEYTYEQMANIMGVHRRTIDGYRDAIFRKLDVRSKTGLVLYAIKHGLAKI
jgi:two-component system invasion response regulator UvrY